MSGKLKSQIAKQSSIGFDDLAGTFSSSATYTMKAKTWSIRRQADPVYRPLTRFLDEKGILNYQCTGSNLFFQTYLADAMNSDPANKDIHVTYLTGFVENTGRGVSRGTMGHFHTAVYSLKYNEPFQELDATPGRTNKEKASEVPFKPIDNPQLNRRFCPKATASMARKEGSDEDAHAKAEGIEKRRQTLTSDEFERILERARIMRNAAVEALRPVYEENSWLKNYQFRDLPGMRLVVLSKDLSIPFKNAVIRRALWSF